MNTLPLAAVALAAALFMASACGSPVDPPADAPSTRADLSPAQHFLDTYVTDDGRVLRHDQGDDVVSEGQAYGMLIAEIAGRPEVAATIWRWTADHLLRPDGTLAFHADQDGNILDDASATDADVLAAFALLRYDGTDASALQQDGRKLADAVLDHAVAWDANGRPYAVAGSWAMQPTVVVNPSYLMPDVFEELASATGDDRWSKLATSAVDGVSEASDDGGSLPTDWARLEDDARLVPTPAPDGSSDARYGLDAQRVPLWFAYSCSAEARSLAARWWPMLDGESSGAIALTPDGRVLDGATNPVPLLAAAASARAAGQGQQADDLAGRAEQQATSTPTYYGDAWLALASALEQGELFAC